MAQLKARPWRAHYSRKALRVAVLALLASLGLAGTTVGTATERVLSRSVSASLRPVSAISAKVAAAKPSDGTGLELASVDNARVTKWMARFTTSMRDEFAIYMKRMATYAPMIADKLAERNMPAQLVYLPMIESGYTPTAKSPAKAAGMWQFMSETARKYGLIVNRQRDERKDPEKSTEAALSYLSDLYKRFGSWYLAAAAYNAGPGRIATALKKATGRTTGTDADYSRISSALPEETQDYVPKLIAAARVADEAIGANRANGALVRLPGASRSGRHSAH